jgi:hypothetical protein
MITNHYLHSPPSLLPLWAEVVLRFVAVIAGIAVLAWIIQGHAGKLTFTGNPMLSSIVPKRIPEPVSSPAKP